MVRTADPTNLDIEHDRDVDLADFFLFQRNYAGSKYSPAPIGCKMVRTADPTKLDIDHDRDVDLADYLLFQRNYTGAK